jgi:hypothetical protein
MMHAAGKWALVLLACGAASGGEEPPGVLERFLAKTEAELKRIPDHVCTQRVERFTRGGEGPWKAVDALALTVGIANGQEIYAAEGGQSFELRAPAEYTRDGVFSTGQFALMARHVFAWRAATIGFRGESERAGRKAYEYEYNVPKEQSTYRLRLANVSGVVSFQGSFHVDQETLDLLELEVQAYDIPERIGLSRADTRVSYARVNVRGMDALLPSAATLLVATVDGLERLNRSKFGECRRFETESKLVAEESGETQMEKRAEAAAEEARRIAPGTMLEIQLDSGLTPSHVRQGDPVRGRLVKALEGAEGVLAPAGAVVHGAVTRFREEAAPFAIYEIGLEFTGIEVAGGILPLRATMVDVERERGLIAEAKRMDPAFSRKQRPRLEMLVREVQEGQGILLWDARRPTVPKGLKMKWRVAEDMAARAEYK